MSINLTPEQKAKLSDPIWRLSNLYPIISKQGQKVTFKPNAIQQRINACRNRRRRILKARQFGVSTNCILALLDDCIFTPNTTNAIISHEQDSIKKLFNIVKYAHKYMPEAVRPTLARGGGSRYEYYFPEIESRIYVDLEIRSGTVHKLHISEAAFADPGRVKASKEAVPINTGHITEETTPNGLGNEFYDDWNTAGDYENLFFPWYVFPDYRIECEPFPYTSEEVEFTHKAKRLYNVDICHQQIALRRAKQRELKSLYYQEYPEDDITCFLASGQQVMDGKFIADLKTRCPGFIREEDGIRIYQEYNKEHRYVIGADPAEGVGSDYSAAVVINSSTMDQVATIRGQHRPADFADLLFRAGNMYQMGGRRWPLLGVECNNHGHAVLLELGGRHLKYPRLYYRDEKREKVGWETNRTTRPLMIDTLIEAIETESVRILDSRIFDECLTLVDNNKKIEAADGKHDDLFIATAIALQMAIVNRKIDLYSDLKSKIKVG